MEFERSSNNFVDLTGKKVVFVLGAGSSTYLGFPDGQGLKKKISSKIQIPDYRARIIELGFSDQQITSLDRALRFGCHETIDEILGSQPALSELGKTLIADVISLVESRQKIENSLSENCWTSRLIQFLDPASDKELYGRIDCHFVTLNYERSMEYIFQNCLIARNPRIGTEFKIPGFTYVHGNIGNLDQVQYGQFSDQPSGLSFNPESRQLAKSLKVLHDNDGVRDQYSDALEKIKSADIVFFLGFGYHQEVTSRFQIAQDTQLTGKYYGIRYEVPDTKLASEIPISYFPIEWRCEEFVQMLHGERSEVISFQGGRKFGEIRFIGRPQSRDDW